MGKWNAIHSECAMWNLHREKRQALKYTANKKITMIINLFFLSSSIRIFLCCCCCSPPVCFCNGHSARHRIAKEMEFQLSSMCVCVYTDRNMLEHMKGWQYDTFMSDWLNVLRISEFNSTKFFPALHYGGCICVSWTQKHSTHMWVPPHRAKPCINHRHNSESSPFYVIFFCQSVCFLSSVILWSFFLLELAIKFTSCWTINTRWHTFPWKREQNRSQSYKKWQRKLDLGREKKREPFHRSHSKQCINEMVLGVKQCNGVDIAAAAALKLHFMPWREGCVYVEYVVCHVQNAEKSWDDIFIRK